jgi:hypothetical protein
MKTRPAFLLAVVFLTAFFPLSLAASSSTADFQPFTLKLKPGSSPAEALRALGKPHAMMGSDLWIYWNFGDPNPNSANPEFDTLVVAFTNGRVTDVKITDGRVVRRLLAQATAQPKPAAVAANTTKR